MLKNAIDRSLSAVGLILLWPVMLALACLIRWRLGKPVLFRQVRIGLNEQPFTFLKFRTMTDRRDPQGNLLSDQQRLTPLGQFLRASSLDELPQLWNVLRGDMSLIGPRPLLPEYLPLYNPRQHRRHEVHPGITGWAQVHGRNAQSWEQRLEQDVWYVEHRSAWIDLKIFVMTIWKVFQREGISQDGHSTMPKFTGTSDK